MTDSDRPDFQEAVARSIRHAEVIGWLATPNNDNAEEVTDADQDLVADKITPLAPVVELADVRSRDQLGEVVPKVIATDPHTGTNWRPTSDVEGLAFVDEMLRPIGAGAHSERYEQGCLVEPAGEGFFEIRS